ncbi:MAG: tRNA uridine(34) 5-carboxymethylaminomethyl modification radical SAM/GNAT enzyme Elp3 [archaeon]
MEWYTQNKKLISKSQWNSEIDTLLKSKSNENIRDILINAVEKRTKNKFGILFSGGLDSSILALLTRNLKPTCYFVGTKDSKDRPYAMEIAKKFKLKYKERIINLEHLRKNINKIIKWLKPNLVNLELGLLLHLALGFVKEKYVLTGSGAEELFAGYFRHREAKNPKEICLEDLKTIYERDLIRNTLLANKQNKILLTPFLDKDLIKVAFSKEIKKDKAVLRKIGRELGLGDYSDRRKLAGQYGSGIDKLIEKLVKEYHLKRKSDITKLQRKPTKSISGVTPIAVVVKPRPCPHGTCIYCPTLNVPQSYTPESPAIKRAHMVNYDPFKQVRSRLKVLQAMHHPTDKIELIIMGGTFLAYPLKYQYEFVKACYDAMNGKESKTLEEAKKLNEKTKHRCIALCVETRPDYCSDKDIKRILDFGATRVELGVQALDDEIYKLVCRGHKIKEVTDATKRLKDYGFKVFYHLMMGLPSVNLKKDIQLFKKVFSDSRFRPDGVKLYPTQVIRGSILEKWYEDGKYVPYSQEELINLLVKLKSLVPRYSRIMRVMREIPPAYLVAGIKRIDLRDVVLKRMKEKNLECKCIRCREVGHLLRKGKEIDPNSIKLCRLTYEASSGKEILLTFEDTKNDILIGLLRLRILPKEKKAFVRELHVYGPELNIGEKKEVSWQHKGYGAQLLGEAEKIVKKEFKIKKIIVISGVGVREYYRKLGYKLEEDYMVKNHNNL